MRAGDLVGISDKEMRAWTENRQGFKALRMAVLCQNSNKNSVRRPPPPGFLRQQESLDPKFCITPLNLNSSNNKQCFGTVYVILGKAQISGDIKGDYIDIYTMKSAYN